MNMEKLTASRENNVNFSKSFLMRLRNGRRRLRITRTSPSKALNGSISVFHANTSSMLCGYLPAK